MLVFLSRPLRRPLGLCALSLLLLACPRKEQPVAPRKKPAAVQKAPARPVSPVSIRNGMVSNYRLRPDRRFLQAAAELHHLFTGDKRSEATVQYVADSWVVQYQKQDVGKLPEFPDFGDGLSLLTRWAAQLEKEHPLGIKDDGGTPAAPAAEEDAAPAKRHGQKHKKEHRKKGAAGAKGEDLQLQQSPALTVQKLKQRWEKGERSAALLREATRALALLSFLSYDLTETADAVPQHALALLALGRAHMTDTGLEEALVADAMGYKRAAEQAAAPLPKGGALRSYLTKDDKTLRKLSTGKNASLTARYLFFLRLCAMKDAAVAESFLEQSLSELAGTVPGVRARLELYRAAPELLGKQDLLEQAAAAVNAEMGGAAAGVQGEKKRAPLALVEESAGKLEQGEKGQLLDGSLAAAYYRSLVYSVLIFQSRIFLETLPPAEARKAFAPLLKDARGPHVGDMDKWYKLMVEAKFNRGNERQLVDRSERLALPNFGAAAHARLFRELRRRFNPGDALLLRAVRALVPRMDTRLLHREQLGEIARENLLDLRLAEQVLGSLLAAAPDDYPAVQLWYAEHSGDTEHLKGLARRGNIDGKTRAQLVGLLSQSGQLTDAQAQREFQRLLKERKEDWSALTAYLGFLERAKDYVAAEKAIAGWLEGDTAGRRPQEAAARTELARFAYLAGDYDAGLQALRPLLDKGQLQAQLRSAALLYESGKKAEGIALARESVKKNAGTESLGTLAELLWREHDYKGAREALGSRSIQLSPADFARVGKHFADVFGKRPAAEGLQAFEPLRDAKLNPLALAQLAIAAAQAKNAELAFGIMSQLQVKGVANTEILIKSYGYLRSFQGDAAALEWIKGKLPEAQREGMAVVAFAEKQDALLWEVVPDTGARKETVWLMRTAAAVRARAKDDPHLQALRDHYGAPGPGGPYHSIGKFLLGMIHEKTLMTQASDSRHTCEIAYYLGLRAQADGRYGDASDWYRVAMETSASAAPEYRWSINQLQRWKQAGKSLSRLAEAQE